MKVDKLHPLQNIVQLQKKGVPTGVYSICSAHRYVIQAGIRQAAENKSLLVIEATSNQVNQFGGYTGMTPLGFREFVNKLVGEFGFPKDKLILGGDHLGPNPWKNEPALQAMDKARVLVKQYVLAGFTKIHLDASMLLGGDLAVDHGQLPPEMVAERAAVLCKAAEEGYEELLQVNPGATAPVYIIGTEVPVPGGTEHEETLRVTRVEDFRETVELSRQAFLAHGLSRAWERVVGVVIQPGVEFGDHSIHEYDRAEAQEISEALQEYDRLAFEGHSTDYQRADSLKEMVEDGVAILKVGPALTFVMREAIFLLQYMENELLAYSQDLQASNVMEVLDTAMLQDNQHWVRYYHGSAHDQSFARKYSMSDRSRYYWTDPKVDDAVRRLIRNLRTVGIPLVLLSQFMPVQYWKIRNGQLKNDPEELIIDRVFEFMADYQNATSVGTMR